MVSIYNSQQTSFNKSQAKQLHLLFKLITLAVVVFCSFANVTHTAQLPDDQKHKYPPTSPVAQRIQQFEQKNPRSRANTENDRDRVQSPSPKYQFSDVDYSSSSSLDQRIQQFEPKSPKPRTNTENDRVRAQSPSPKYQSSDVDYSSSSSLDQLRQQFEPKSPKPRTNTENDRVRAQSLSPKYQSSNANFSGGYLGRIGPKFLPAQIDKDFSTLASLKQLEKEPEDNTAAERYFEATRIPELYSPPIPVCSTGEIRRVSCKNWEGWKIIFSQRHNDQLVIQLYDKFGIAREGECRLALLPSTSAEEKKRAIMELQGSENEKQQLYQDTVSALLDYVSYLNDNSRDYKTNFEINVVEAPTGTLILLGKLNLQGGIHWGATITSGVMIAGGVALKATAGGGGPLALISPLTILSGSLGLPVAVILDRLGSGLITAGYYSIDYARSIEKEDFSWKKYRKEVFKGVAIGVIPKGVAEFVVTVIDHIPFLEYGGPVKKTLEKWVEKRVQEMIKKKSDGNTKKNSISNEDSKKVKPHTPPLNVPKVVDDFSMGSFLSLMEKASKSTKGIEGKPLVLFLGPTSVVKNTTINYLLGKNKRPATQYPTCYVSLDSSMIYCECPGFFDKQKKEEELCTSLSIREAIELSGGIQALVFCLDRQELRADKGDILGKMVDTLAQMLQQPSQHIPSLFIMFTGPYKLDEYIGELKSKLKKIRKNNRESSRNDQQNVEVLLESILKYSETNLFSIDPRDHGKSRDGIIFHEVLHSSNPIPMEEVGFIGDDSMKEDCKKYLVRPFVKGHIETLKVLTTYPSEIAKLQQGIEGHNKAIRNINRARNRRNVTEELMSEYNARGGSCESRVTALQNQNQQLNEKIREHNINEPILQETLVYDEYENTWGLFPSRKAKASGVNTTHTFGYAGLPFIDVSRIKEKGKDIKKRDLVKRAGGMAIGGVGGLVGGIVGGALLGVPVAATLAIEEDKGEEGGMPTIGKTIGKAVGYTVATPLITVGATLAGGILGAGAGASGVADHFDKRRFDYQETDGNGPKAGKFYDEKQNPAAGRYSIKYDTPRHALGRAEIQIYVEKRIIHQDAISHWRETIQKNKQEIAKLEESIKEVQKNNDRTASERLAYEENELNKCKEKLGKYEAERGNKIGVFESQSSTFRAIHTISPFINLKDKLFEEFLRSYETYQNIPQKRTAFIDEDDTKQDTPYQR